MAFTTIGLSDRLVQGVLATGYTAPTEIQSQAIPAAIDGKDIIGCAQTGTGKTAAFVLPILHRLTKPGTDGPKSKGIKSLILTPTRELAVQIETSIRTYGRFLKLKSLTVYGGVSMQAQLTALRHGVDIVVATPGRLLDHMQRGSINLSLVEIFVLDEADRMFDMGFIKDVRRIIAKLPEKRQTMLFSATLSPEVTVLVKDIQHSPKIIQIGRANNPIETITQYAYKVEQDLKLDFLLHLLQTNAMFSVLVFSRTKHGADRIRRRLDRENISSVTLHSGKTQAQRQQALQGFKSGKFQVMVATDIAARGIDVAGISHVINFDVPMVSEDYIHRIGRTGRATATGDAITFVSRDEERLLTRIERFINRKLHLTRHPTFSYKKTETPEKKHKDGEIDRSVMDDGEKPAKKWPPKKPRYGAGAKPAAKYGAGAKPAAGHGGNTGGYGGGPGAKYGAKPGSKPRGKYGPKPSGKPGQPTGAKPESTYGNKPGGAPKPRFGAKPWYAKKKFGPKPGYPKRPTDNN